MCDPPRIRLPARPRGWRSSYSPPLILIGAVVFTAGSGSDQPLKPILLATGEWAPYSGEAIPDNGIASAIVAAVLRRAGYEPTFQFM